MTTARSSFSLARLLPVYRNIMRRNRGSAAFYGVLGFICLPVQYLLTVLKNRSETDDSWMQWSLFGPAQVYNGFSAFFFTMLMLMVSLIMAVNLFSYLHNRRSVDVYHSLPLTRSEMFTATTMAGITLIWVPMIINFLLTAGISLLLPWASMGAILIDLLCWMVITLAVFAITAFCAVQLGTDFDTVIFSIGLNGAAAAIYLLFILMADGFIYGFSASDDIVRIAYRLSPVSTIIGRIAIGAGPHEYLVENNITMVIWLAISILVLVAGAWVYTRRKSEQAESVGEMRPLQLFMRSAATLLGGTGLGMVFCAVFEISPEHEKLMSLFCIAIGSLIVYFIGDVILSRSVRNVLRAIPVAALTTAGVCALISTMMFDFVGIAKWQPKLEEVAEMQLYNYNSRFEDQPSLGKDNMRNSFYAPEAVALVLAAQREQVEQHFSGADDTDYNGNLRITYVLKNGKTVERHYYSLYPSVIKQLEALEVNEELIKNSHPAFFSNAEMITKVETTNAFGNKTDLLALTATQKQQLLATLQEDLLAQPLSELQGGAAEICSLDIEYRYSRIPSAGASRYSRHPQATDATRVEDEYYYATSQTMITTSYQKTLALLQQFGAVGSLENDWAQIKTAYAFPFNRGYSGTTSIAQSDLERVRDTKANVEDFIENYQEGPLTLASFRFTPMEFSAIRSSLTSIAPVHGEAYAVVAVAAGEGNDEITGHFLAPVSALPAHLKTALGVMVQSYYGDYVISSWGYTETVVATETTVAVTN